MERWTKSPFPCWVCLISVSVLPNTEKRYAVIIWKSSTAGCIAVLPTGWFDRWYLPLRKLLALDMLEYLVYFSHVCFCCILPSLLAFYAWTWYFYPFLCSIFFRLSFFCLHLSSSLVREVFFVLFTRLKDDLQPLYQLVLQDVSVSKVPIWRKACKVNSRTLVQNPSVVVAAWCLCFWLMLLLIKVPVAIWVTIWTALGWL